MTRNEADELLRQLWLTGGFTWRPDALPPETDCTVSLLAWTWQYRSNAVTAQVILDYAAAHAALLADGCWLGGWDDGAGHVWLDVNHVVSCATANQTACEQGQKAWYDNAAKQAYWADCGGTK